MAVVVAVAACGDPATEDRGRGYTKAPLETPGLLIRGEPDFAMASVAITLEPGLTWSRPASAEAAGEAADGPEPADDSGAAESDLAAGVTRAQYDEGRALFTGTAGCMACHGQEGGGTPIGPDLTDDEWLNVDAPDVSALAEVIQAGVSDPRQFPAPMPPMGGGSLTAEQVEALAGYVASLGGV